MVTAIGLPLLIVNGKFQSLSSMTVEDLEAFIPFLVKCSVNKAGAELINGVPEWWSSIIKCKFPLKKPNGLSQIGYHRHLSSIVCSCYWYHDAQYLLPFCAKIAKSSESVFLKSNEDITVQCINNKNQILKINNENKIYDSTSKKEKPFRRSLLSTLPRKSAVIPDIYLCENCDAEFYSHSEMQKHEKECYNIVIDDVKNKPKKDGCSDGSGIGAESCNPINKKKQDNLPKEIEILKHIKPNSGPSIKKKNFFNYLMLQSKSSETVKIKRLPKLENGRRSHYLHWMNVDCLHKCRKIEFSSLLGRKMLENSSKRELVNKIGRNFLINEYYCSTSTSSRIVREHKETMDFKVTCKKPKKSTWTHQYCFNKKQRRSRLITLKTGLNERSRKLLQQCKKFRIVVNRLNTAS